MICVMNSCFDHVSLSKMLVEKIVSVLDINNFPADIEMISFLVLSYTGACGF